MPNATLIEQINPNKNNNLYKIIITLLTEHRYADCVIHYFEKYRIFEKVRIKNQLGSNIVEYSVPLEEWNLKTEMNISINKICQDSVYLYETIPELNNLLNCYMGGFFISSSDDGNNYIIITSKNEMYL
jgi:hypothetical protein